MNKKEIGEKINVATRHGIKCRGKIVIVHETINGIQYEIEPLKNANINYNIVVLESEIV